MSKKTSPILVQRDAEKEGRVRYPFELRCKYAIKEIVFKYLSLPFCVLIVIACALFSGRSGISIRWAFGVFIVTQVLWSIFLLIFDVSAPMEIRVKKHKLLVRWFKKEEEFDLDSVSVRSTLFSGNAIIDTGSSRIRVYRSIENYEALLEAVRNAKRT